MIVVIYFPTIENALWSLLVINTWKKFKALPNINEIPFNIHLLVSFGSAEVELCLTVGPDIDWE